MVRDSRSVGEVLDGLADVWLGSAEVVARMLVGEIDGTGKWEVPEWLPRCYLTVPLGDSEASGSQ